MFQNVKQKMFDFVYNHVFAKLFPQLFDGFLERVVHDPLHDEDKRILGFIFIFFVIIPDLVF